LPAELHDTELIWASPPAFKIPKPGTSLAWPQRPFRSLTTNTWKCEEPSVYPPPAAQLPAELHDTEETWAAPPAFKVEEPGTSLARPQRPFRSLTTNACSLAGPSA
jgi:hypothetical protein